MYGDIWTKEDYLSWMFENLQAIKSVMSETASIYVHLDWHIGHYVKVLLDEVFGEGNFLNEIVWHYGQRTSPRVRQFDMKHDSLFLYGRSEETRLYEVTIPWSYEEFVAHRHDVMKDEDGEEYIMSDAGDGTRYKRLVKDVVAAGKPLDSVWDIPLLNSSDKQRVGYSTQKPEELLDRIVKASSSSGMVVADFFGGSGVTAKVAHDLGRRFIHVDVGVNSLQTARDRLKSAGAAFRVLDIQDGVSLYRNPVQTMDKLKTLIAGLKNEDGLDKFWEGAIADSKLGTMPVYLPNLLDHSTKVLDVPLINRIINEAMPDLPEDTKQVVVYYVDIFDRGEVEKFISDHNMTGVDIELRDLKEILDEVVLSDEVEYVAREEGIEFEVEIARFASDRLVHKIDEYNQKKGLNGKAKSSLLEPETEEFEDDEPELETEDTEEEAPTQRAAFKPIQLSDNGLELLEWLSLDCTSSDGAWHSDSEIKIDKKGFVIRNGIKTKEFWDAKITSTSKPLRLKVRNIAGDETTLALD